MRRLDGMVDIGGVLVRVDLPAFISYIFNVEQRWTYQYLIVLRK
jgi:hypothetical protein